MNIIPPSSAFSSFTTTLRESQLVTVTVIKQRKWLHQKQTKKKRHVTIYIIFCIRCMNIYICKHGVRNFKIMLIYHKYNNVKRYQNDKCLRQDFHHVDLGLLILVIKCVCTTIDWNKTEMCVLWIYFTKVLPTLTISY